MVSRPGLIPRSISEIAFGKKLYHQRPHHLEALTNKPFHSKTHFVPEGERHYNMESMYDYGSRAGFWRLHRLFTKKKLPCTVFAVGMALERNPAVCHALKETPSWEVASHGKAKWCFSIILGIDYRLKLLSAGSLYLHPLSLSTGYRWIDYQNVDEETERDHIARTVHIHERLLGKRPVGIYQGKVS